MCVIIGYFTGTEQLDYLTSRMTVILYGNYTITQSLGVWLQIN